MRCNFIKSPKWGDEKVIRKFVWFPTIFKRKEETVLVWLEFCYAKFRYDGITSHNKWGQYNKSDWLRVTMWFLY